MNPRRILSVAVFAALVALNARPSVAGSISLEDYANGGRILLPAAAALATVAIQDRDGFKQLGFSMANTLALTEALKLAIDAERPNGGGGHAFPSGHAAAAFSGAAFVHQRYGWQWGIPAELAAAGVAYARVHEGAHRWRDVAASAAIAHLSAFVYVDPRDETVTLLPFVDGQKRSFGLVVQLAF